MSTAKRRVLKGETRITKANRHIVFPIQRSRKALSFAAVREDGLR